MEELIQEMLKKKTWAVAGVSTNKKKYGYIIYKRLKEKGYKVYAINPKVNKIDGENCYKDINELPEVPEVINIVTPPKATEQIVEKCKTLGIKYIWIQPGAESEKAIESARKAGIKVLHNTCVYKLAK
jgi:hypothetical protein